VHTFWFLLWKIFLKSSLGIKKKSNLGEQSALKVFSESIEIKSGSRKQIVNITDRLDGLITNSGIQNGVLTKLVKHSTAFLIISSMEESLRTLA